MADDADLVIEVLKVPPEGYVVLGDMTYQVGRHRLWNEDVPSWPEFEALERDGYIRRVEGDRPS